MPNAAQFAVLGRLHIPNGPTQKFRSPPDSHFKTKGVAETVLADMQTQHPTWTFIIEETITHSPTSQL
jgi:hypothetical protein